MVFMRTEIGQHTRLIEGRLSGMNTASLEAGNQKFPKSGARSRRGLSCGEGRGRDEARSRGCCAPHDGVAAADTPEAGECQTSHPSQAEPNAPW
jgi:hypothetical protein